MKRSNSRNLAFQVATLLGLLAGAPFTARAQFYSTYANGINNSGEFVGTYTSQYNSGGFMNSGGVYTTLNDPTGLAGTTTPHGINDSGQIVGDYLDSSGNQHGFLYSGGSFTTLNGPPAQLTRRHGGSTTPDRSSAITSTAQATTASCIPAGPTPRSTTPQGLRSHFNKPWLTTSTAQDRSSARIGAQTDSSTASCIPAGLTRRSTLLTACIQPRTR